MFLEDNNKKGSGGNSNSGSSGQVNVDVDVEAWPAADAVQMLQTVKDALNVQLLEVRAGLRAYCTYVPRSGVYEAKGLPWSASPSWMFLFFYLPWNKRVCMNISSG